MELSWSTFFLEILNFLVLVWILKRFLYKPVLDVIARRRNEIDQRLNEAKHLHEEAQTLKSQYENRLADWEHERQQAREILTKEIDTERSNKLADLQNQLRLETERSHAAEAKRRANERQQMESTALEHSAQFASRLLSQTAGPDTEHRLIDLLVQQIIELKPEQQRVLKGNYGKTSEEILINSAYPIPDSQRQHLFDTLTKTLSTTITIRYEINPELIAGIQITLGSWILAANVRDELKGFAELSRYA